MTRAARIATDAGLDVVMDRCVKIEYARIMGGLNWAGVEHRRRVRRARRPSTMTDRKYGFDTLCLHAGHIPDATTGARGAAHLSDHVLRVRQRRPRREPLQPADIRQCLLAHLESDRGRVRGARRRARGRSAHALAAATGMAAQMVALLTLAQNGDHIVAARTLYGGTYSQLAVTFAQFGIAATFVDPDEPDAFRRALRPETKAVLRRNDRQPAAQRPRHRRRRVHRPRRRRAAGHRQHARLPVSVPPHRARRRHRDPLGDQVSRRPRNDHGRRDRSSPASSTGETETSRR